MGERERIHRDDPIKKDEILHTPLRSQPRKSEKRMVISRNANQRREWSYHVSL